MVVDCILYNGEADILEIRLSVLNEFVDQFVICEAKTTFSGKPKPLYFEQQKERFSQWLPKIKYSVIDENDPELWKIAHSSPNTGGIEHWEREFIQRESIKKAIIHLQDEDICYISDCDEIWKAQEIGDDIYKIEQKVYSYYLNNRSSESWAGTFVGKYKNIKNELLNHLRAGNGFKLNDRSTWNGRIILLDAGWHFTNIGGVEELKRKIESYGHQELNTESFKNTLSQKIKDNVDYMGFRDFKMWVDESDLPKYILDNKEKYGKLFR